jgi:ankyrin repeat protein
MENNINLKQNYIPVYSDIFGIILSDLNLRDLINFSLSCRKHYEIVETENNNLIWKTQMIKLCPAFEACCGYTNNGTKYKDIVKEIIFLRKHNEYSTDPINFLKNSLQDIIYVFKDYDHCKFLGLMLTNYLIKNLEKFNKDILNRQFMRYCHNNNVDLVKILLNYSVKYPGSINVWRCDGLIINLSYFRGNIEIVKLLLNHLKKYPNTINGDSPTLESYPNDVFVDICKKESSPSGVEIVKLILDFFCGNVQKFDYIDTNQALFCACTSGNIEIVELLLNYSTKYPEEKRYPFKICPKKIKFGEKYEITTHRIRIKKEIVRLLIEYSKKNNYY